METQKLKMLNMELKEKERELEDLKGKLEESEKANQLLISHYQRIQHKIRFQEAKNSLSTPTLPRSPSKSDLDRNWRSPQK
jgi:chromosome segregation ATPase